MWSELHAHSLEGILAAGSWLAGRNPRAPGMKKRCSGEPISGLPSQVGGAKLGGEGMGTPLAPRLRHCCLPALPASSIRGQHRAALPPLGPRMKVSVVSDSLRPHGLYSPWNSPGQNTGVGSLSLLQGNLPNPGIEPRSPALQADPGPRREF